MGPANLDSDGAGQTPVQTVLGAADDLDRNDLAQQVIRALDVDRLQIGRATDGLTGVAPLLLEQDGQGLARLSGVEGGLLFEQEGRSRCNRSSPTFSST